MGIVRRLCCTCDRYVMPREGAYVRDHNIDGSVKSKWRFVHDHSSCIAGAPEVWGEDLNYRKEQMNE